MIREITEEEHKQDLKKMKKFVTTFHVPMHNIINNIHDMYITGADHGVLELIQMLGLSKKEQDKLWGEWWKRSKIRGDCAIYKDWKVKAPYTEKTYEEKVEKIKKKYDEQYKKIFGKGKK